MNITDYKNINNVDTLTDLVKFCANNFGQIISIINGNIELLDNCNLKLVPVSFPKANTTYPFAHKLNRLPIGYILVGLSASAQVFDGIGNNSITNIYLQASAICNGRVLVF